MTVVVMRVRRGFLDLKAQRYRPTGEVFEADEERAQILVSAGVAEIVGFKAAPAPPDATEQEAPRPRRRRKGDA